MLSLFSPPSPLPRLFGKRRGRLNPLKDCGGFTLSCSSSLGGWHPEDEPWDCLLKFGNLRIGWRSTHAAAREGQIIPAVLFVFAERWTNPLGRFPRARFVNRAIVIRTLSGFSIVGHPWDGGAVMVAKGKESPNDRRSGHTLERQKFPSEPLTTKARTVMGGALPNSCRSTNGLVSREGEASNP